MIRNIIIAITLLGSVGIVFAQENDPIATRKAIMKGVGDGFYGDIGKMNKGTNPYDQAKVIAALNKIVDASKKMPTLFPDSARTGGETHALPAIWDNKADFNARYDQLGKDAATALTLVKDAASLKEQSAIVGKNCTNCHQKYRAKLD